jgi:hypothetical protein
MTRDIKMECAPLDLSVNKTDIDSEVYEKPDFEISVKIEPRTDYNTTDDSDDYSSDHGGGPNCKAYKKSLMKRYCKCPNFTYFPTQKR